MALSGDQFREIETALLDGYGTTFALRRMVRLGLDESLDRIAGGSNRRSGQKRGFSKKPRFSTLRLLLALVGGRKLDG